jgi:hypothetical protein
MLILLLTATLFSQAVGPASEPAEWRSVDPGVRFVEGTTAPPVEPVDGWRGRAEISVRCVVQADGALDNCAVVHEAPTGVLRHQSALRSVGRMRMVLDDDSPRPGDFFTIEVVVTTGRGR